MPNIVLLKSLCLLSFFFLISCSSGSTSATSSISGDATQLEGAWILFDESDNPNIYVIMDDSGNVTDLSLEGYQSTTCTIDADGNCSITIKSTYEDTTFSGSLTDSSTITLSGGMDGSYLLKVADRGA
ncbi:MAG: hypothetical protein HRU15_06930, partial [Planctomycetes bacterium]|nr:hypothetical protein [Planctomycetota bacterium]